MDRLWTALLVAEYVKTLDSGVTPDIDPKLIIDPPWPDSTRWRPNTWQPKNTLLRLTRRIRSNSSSVISRNGVAELTPAPFTTTSTRPARCSTAARRASSAGLLVASAAWNHARPPLASMLARRAAAFCSLRPPITTSAPAPARPSAIAPHNSPVPPMTTATLSLRENSVFRNSAERIVWPMITESEMSVIGRGLLDGYLDTDELTRIARDGLASIPLDGQRVLVLIPDGTRTMPMPFMFQTLERELGRRVTALDYLVALGTHSPMSDAQLTRLIGQPVVNGVAGRCRIFNHRWDDPATFTLLGTILAREAADLTRG